jgi:hypothetical protein
MSVVAVGIARRFDMLLALLEDEAAGMFRG